MNSDNIKPNSNIKYAIRFGLGAIKAVGFNMMIDAVKERKTNGTYSDIYDFCRRSDPKSINKKSIEALSKSGALDSVSKNRRQTSESFEILSNYANEFREEKNSDQMNLFAGISEINPVPKLKNISDWNKKQKLKSEFEAFGFFLNEHPIDDKIKDLKLRGVVFSYKIDEDSLEDNSIIKIAGVVSSSKHRSSSRGRFAYLNISDPYGIFEATIFDEALITQNRDLLEDGCEIVIECLIKKDDGGTRIMIKSVYPLENFIIDTTPKDKEFEDIKKLPARKINNKKHQENNAENFNNTKYKSNKEEVINLNKNEPKLINRRIKIIEILISDNKAILPLKTVILQKKIDLKDSNDSLENGTQLFLIAHNSGVKILLDGKYKIEEIDIFRLKNLHPKIQIDKILYDEDSNVNC